MGPIVEVHRGAVGLRGREKGEGKMGEVKGRRGEEARGPSRAAVDGAEQEAVFFLPNMFQFSQ